MSREWWNDHLAGSVAELEILGDMLDNQTGAMGTGAMGAMGTPSLEANGAPSFGTNGRCADVKSLVSGVLERMENPSTSIPRARCQQAKPII